MSSARPPDSVTKLRVPPPDLRLENWPLRDAKLASALAITLVVTASVMAAQFSGSVGMGVLTCLALAAALWRMWLPVTLEFGAAGIVETIGRRRSRTPWSLVRRCDVFRAGVFLQIGDETRRGRYVRWNRQRRELLSILEYYLGPHATRPTSTGSTATVPAERRIESE